MADLSSDVPATTSSENNEETKNEVKTNTVVTSPVVIIDDYDPNHEKQSAASPENDIPKSKQSISGRPRKEAFLKNSVDTNNVDTTDDKYRSWKKRQSLFNDKKEIEEHYSKFFEPSEGVYSRMVLTVDDTIVSLQTIDKSLDVLMISRINFNIACVKKTEAVSLPLTFKPFEPQNPLINYNTVTEVQGILGFVDLLSGTYLIVITETERLGLIGTKPVYLIKKTHIVQVPVDDTDLTEDEKKLERLYIDLLMSFLESSKFYFCTEFDITRCIEAQARLSDSMKDLPLWKRADQRFFWNYSLNLPLMHRDLDKWIIPVMDGFVSISPCTIRDQKFDYVLISRRSCMRNGARYHARGADANGHVANFVESEQIVLHCGHMSSFVQIRGSIPIIWKQTGKSLKPKPTADHIRLARQCFASHFKDLSSHYGPRVDIVSLIDQTGAEADLGAQFETQFKLLNNSDLRYIAFDFHNKCKNNKWDQLQLLLDIVKDDMKNFGYYLHGADGVSIMKQSGIFRTNCIDCLDRTNVVQSLFAHHILATQLSHLGIITALENLESFTAFETIFKNDNADRMSEQYTGTGALKTDFTRTGKRSIKGMATDGINSMRRYLNQLFEDSDRQVSMDLFLKKFDVGKIQFLDFSGVYRFDVAEIVRRNTEDQTENNNLVIQEWSINGFIEVNVIDRVIRACAVESGQIRIYPFDTLKYLDKPINNYKLLNLMFSTQYVSYCMVSHSDRSNPYTCLFASAVARQQFTDVIWQHCFGIPKPLPDSITFKASTFIATWNMRNIIEAPTEENLKLWIPMGYMCYAIAVQNCTYKVPSEYQSINSPQYHLFYIVQSYMGNNYETIATVSTRHQNDPITDMIVLVHKDFGRAVSSVHVTKVYNMAKQSVEKASGPAAFLKGKLNEAKEKFKMDKSSKDQHIGGAIICNIYDTVLCFMNIDAGFKELQPSKSNDSKQMTSKVMPQLKGEYDIASDFDHVFCIGIISRKQIEVARYVELFSGIPLPQLPEYSPSIYWRSRPGSDFLSEISGGSIKQNSEMADGSGIYANLSMMGLNAPAVLEQSHFWRIIISTLRMTNIPSNLVNKECCVAFYAPFLVNGLKTTLSKKGAWYDEAELKFYQPKSYVELSYLSVEIWNTESIGDEICGKGLISLKGLRQGNFNFEVSLTKNDEFAGTLLGSVFLPQTSKPLPVTPKNAHGSVDSTQASV